MTLKSLLRQLAKTCEQISLNVCIRSDLHFSFFKRVKGILPIIPNHTITVIFPISEIFSIQIGIITVLVPPSSGTQNSAMRVIC